ncbi:hypothetical protein KAI65_00115 [Candidatus Parcubacteria bacterium]|nr:hypothetical protein [Candidatus Parcubacteria bacterium]
MTKKLENFELENFEFFKNLIFGTLLVACAIASILGIFFELSLPYVIIPIGIIILILVIGVVCNASPKLDLPV